MLNNKAGLILIALIFGGLFQVSAQVEERVPFDQGTQYILANVRVTGKVSYNEQTIITFSGLEKGEPITIPGEEISNAVKKLGKLGLFSDIDFYVDRISNDSIYLLLKIEEFPKLNDVKITGVKKGKVEGLIKDNGLTKGKVVNENLITTTKNYIQNKYQKDGYYNTKVNVNVVSDTTSGNNVNMVVNIDKGDKVKVSKITITGNEKFSDGKLKRTMKNTKQRNVFRLWKRSKYIKEKYKEDLTSVIDKYKEKGYRDARVVSDSVVYNRTTNDIAINIKLEEGRKYYFGDITFLGNTLYSDNLLKQIIGIKRGDVYNGVLLEKRINDKKDPESENITNLYQNNGYLFSNVNAVETRTENDTIDFEVRIVEGPLAYFNKITVVGNDKTNDKVIYRELRTRPGQKYSKEQLVRTVREIGQLGFFDAEAIDPKFKNVDPSAGTVDIEYNLVEKGSSQIELQGGYGGGGFIGTLGLSFNNFSLRNIFNKDAYDPLPMGDGQKVSLRAQAASYFQTYSVTFSEPWFGGKKPIQFNTSLSYSKQFVPTGNSYNDVDKNRSFGITSLSIGIAKKLQVPDDYFVLSNALSFQYYDLKNYNTNLFKFGNGSAKNIAYTFGLTRNSKGINPIFPTQGSEFSFIAKFSPPYTLLSGTNYEALKSQEAYKLKNNTSLPIPSTDGTGFILPGQYIDENGNRADSYVTAKLDDEKFDRKRFEYLEFYKIKFKGDWYTKLFGKLVLRSLGEFGYLGAYDKGRGVIPFERFYLGGDGLANYSLDGRETIQLRGYPNNSLSGEDGGSIYNKFSMELRYPVTLKGAASIYVLSFLEAGASYDNFSQYNPFALQRSAGAGLRIFMPAFGLLGIDFGYGFDPIPGTLQKSGFQTHFIIGQQF